jgi:Uma2 family endonuclease
MQMWIKNGVALGWLINPFKEEVFIYRQDGTVSLVKGFRNVIAGETVLPGFTFDLQKLSTQQTL